MSFSSGNPVAVLVDAESVDAGDARSAVAALSARFAPLILHAFGDFRNSALKTWCDVLEEFDGQALQVTPTEGHENSVHVCLTMNAMEIIHAESASAVCIFCGSGDFSQLAVRVRKAGLPVLGFGTAEAGKPMAPWFDSWLVIGAGEFYELDPPPAGTEQVHAAAQTEPGNEFVEPPVVTSVGADVADDVTEVDIEATVQSARTRVAENEPENHARGEAYPTADTSLEDVDVMAAIEGKRNLPRETVTNPPPLADDAMGEKLTEDATLLLSGFITDNLSGNGYALLSDVANAATATDLLVPPEKKTSPDEHLKRLVASDTRFEITTMPMGSGEPEFIRRV